MHTHTHARTRYVAASLGRSIRFVGLSTALANAHDLADWLGCTPGAGLFNFKPSVRPVPLEAHMQGYPGAARGCAALVAARSKSAPCCCVCAGVAPVLVGASAQGHVSAPLQRRHTPLP
jgi:activating signal cointegrator complex subunit 3